MPQSTVTPIKARKRSPQTLGFYDWECRATDALELARDMPPGPERTAALKHAGLLRSAADARALIFPDRPRRAK